MRLFKQGFCPIMLGILLAAMLDGIPGGIAQGNTICMLLMALNHYLNLGQGKY